MSQPLSEVQPRRPGEAAVVVSATRVVAVAASAGGVEALELLVSGLPADLRASVLVALHMPRDAHSMLTQILARVATLPVAVAEHGAPLWPGQIYVAPPDCHLLVRDGVIVLGRGPREHGHRPAHDAMLRAVALEAGQYATGVVLTGLLDDSAAGLAVVSRYGGACLIQDPADSEFPSMPLAALAAVPTARILPLAELAEGVARAVNEAPAASGRGIDPAQRELDLVELFTTARGTAEEAIGGGRPTGRGDGHGELSVSQEVVRFRGRALRPSSLGLAAEEGEQVEKALWVALAVLQERADLSRRLAGEAKLGQRDWSWMNFVRRAEEADRSAAVIRRVLEEEFASTQRAAPPAGS